MVYNGKTVHEMVEFSVKKHVTEVYSWGVNTGNGDMQIEVYAFDSSSVKITTTGVGFKLETDDHLFYQLSDDHNTLFDSAVVMDDRYVDLICGG